MSTQERRREALRKLCDEYGLTIGGTSTSADEDIAAYFPSDTNPDPDEIDRWCAVTCNDNINYLYRYFDSKREAQLKALENVTDGIYPEIPVCIVNIDTGKSFEPNWERLTWRSAK
jgi:hypothetical protein